MPRAGYVYDPVFLEHTLPGHPESAARLAAIMDHLERQGTLRDLVEIKPRDVTREELLRVHDGEHLARALAETRTDHGWLDVDTYVTPSSAAAALKAAGGAIEAARAVIAGELDSAFCLVRPPGHHATPTEPMGFCLLNNVAIAAADSLAGGGLERVAIVDFDVHHGNGTQDAFAADPRVLYFSVHQSPLYPGTGGLEDRGAAGQMVNVPLPPGCGDEAYLAAVSRVCAPALTGFRPQLILVSAGFDAHFADPLANELVSTHGYYRMASVLREIADQVCDGRLVYVLEGGYDLVALAWSVQACIDTLLGREFDPDPLGPGPEVRGPDVSAIVDLARDLHRLSA
jgi:acetoin utilization deacetylase AcuC-like enzyme